MPPAPPAPIVVPALASAVNRSRAGSSRLHWRDLVEKPDDDYEVAEKQLACTEWREDMMKRCPEGFPSLQLNHALRWPAVLHQRGQSNLLMDEVTEVLLNDPWCEEHWWGPLRRGEEVQVPSVAVARIDEAGRAEIEFEFR
jgi:hypothetical protein